MSEYLPEISIKISWQLRHNKENLKFKKENQKMWDGFVPVNHLINILNISVEDLIKIVETDKKGRYSFNSDYTEIKANQGHSLEVDLFLKSSIPPIKLYHGTNSKFYNSIIEKGLLPMSRQYVHLSEDIETAIEVAKRKGEDFIILEIDVEEMLKNEIDFFQSQNGVWLVYKVESKYLRLFKS